jgi:hypothetical protein
VEGTPEMQWSQLPPVSLWLRKKAEFLSHLLLMSNNNRRRLVFSPAQSYEDIKLELPGAWEPPVS